MAVPHPQVRPARLRRPAPADDRTVTAPIDTRQRILDAARVIFARYGYVDASIEQIVTLCHVSRGTFYYYFKNKEDVFEQLVLALNDAMDQVRVRSIATDPYLKIEATNRAYFAMWAEHHDIMANLAQISAIEPRFEVLHRRIRSRFIDRVRRHLERAVPARECRELNPEIASSALGGMVDAFAYHWLGTGWVAIENATLEQVVQELSELWYHALYGGRPHAGGLDGQLG